MKLKCPQCSALGLLYLKPKTQWLLSTDGWLRLPEDLLEDEFHIRDFAHPVEAGCTGCGWVGTSEEINRV